MEGTCNEKGCKLHDLLGGAAEQCPNFVQSWWTPHDGGEPKLVNDCAPKRTMLMVSELHNRLIGLQQAQEQQRNQSGKAMDAMTLIIGRLAGINPGASEEAVLIE